MPDSVHAASAGPPGPRRGEAAQRAWLDALRSPELRFAVRVFGDARLGPGWDTGERRMASHLVFGVVAGAFRCACAGLPERMRAGDLFWISAGTTHRLHDADDGTRAFHLNTELLLRRRRIALPEGTLYAPAQPEAVAELGRLRERHIAEHPWWEAQAQAWLCWTYLRLAERRSGAAGPRLDPAQIAALQVFADAEVARHPGPRELAARCGLSLDHFTRAFRATFGLPPRRWLLRRRIAAAAELLEREDLSVAELAQRLGYRDPYLFSRQFRAVMGCAPSAFRTQDRGDHA